VIIIKIDIVGGSLGGLSTAISLKRLDKNIDVVVHEKYKTIGYNHEGRRCGEGYAIEDEWKKWQPTGNSIFNTIKTVETIVGDKTYTAQREPGTFYMLNRQEFICQMAREAERLGAEIRTDDKIRSIDDLDGDYIVDASGCPSSIKKQLGLNKGINGVTYQQTLEDSNWFIADTIKVIFTDAIGYYWVFPRNPEKREINLGLGVVGAQGHNLKDMLETFKQKHNIDGKVNYVVGGLIPAGIQRPLRYRNILFVGDAGVGTFPLLGAGIYRALISGEIAASCLSQACPERYPKAIYQAFIKWELIGKTFLRMDQVLMNIGKNALFAVYHLYLDCWYSFY